MSKDCLLVNLGLIAYVEAWNLQKRLVATRKASLAEPARDEDSMTDVLLFCEHPHVITLGRNAKRENLLASEHVLRQKGVELHASDRGGDITYHGPGQIVGYPILNLAAIRRDVVCYVRALEEAMIRATAEFGIVAERIPGKTGVWVKAKEREEKLAAIGVHISRWVTSHGFAYNVSTDLRYFDLIVPCGIVDRKVTSLEKLLERKVQKAEITSKLARHLGELFGLEMKQGTRRDLLEKLERAERSATVSAYKHLEQRSAVSA